MVSNRCRSSVEGGGSRRVRILPNLNGEVDECGNCRDRSDKFSKTSEILNRHFHRPAEWALSCVAQAANGRRGTQG